MLERIHKIEQIGETEFVAAPKVEVSSPGHPSRRAGEMIARIAHGWDRIGNHSLRHDALSPPRF
ncbi:MAG: hypothetical protein O3A96_02005 [Proteobacteria bacterium]|nr:hypothetical protein [Pseudomonadota bacterium]